VNTHAQAIYFRVRQILPRMRCAAQNRAAFARHVPQRDAARPGDTRDAKPREAFCAARSKFIKSLSLPYAFRTARGLFWRSRVSAGLLHHGSGRLASRTALLLNDHSTSSSGGARMQHSLCLTELKSHREQ
jgi:hypothetical protein